MKQRKQPTAPKLDKVPTTTATQFESDTLAQVRNFVQETLLLETPDEWPLDAIEGKVLDRLRWPVRSYDQAVHRFPNPTQHFINMAVDQTRKLIEETKLSRAKWLYPDDPELTTLQVTLPNEVLDEIDESVIAHGLHDREQFVSAPVEYVLQLLTEESMVVA